MAEKLQLLSSARHSARCSLRRRSRHLLWSYRFFFLAFSAEPGRLLLALSFLFLCGPSCPLWLKLLFLPCLARRSVRDLRLRLWSLSLPASSCRHEPEYPLTTLL